MIGNALAAQRLGRQHHWADARAWTRGRLRWSRALGRTKMARWSACSRLTTSTTSSASPLSVRRRSDAPRRRCSASTAMSLITASGHRGRPRRGTSTDEAAGQRLETPPACRRRCRIGRPPTITVTGPGAAGRWIKSPPTAATSPPPPRCLTWARGCPSHSPTGSPPAERVPHNRPFDGTVC